MCHYNIRDWQILWRGGIEINFMFFCAVFGFSKVSHLTLGSKINTSWAFNYSTFRINLCLKFSYLMINCKIIDSKFGSVNWLNSGAWLFDSKYSRSANFAPQPNPFISGPMQVRLVHIPPLPARVMDHLPLDSSKKIFSIALLINDNTILAKFLTYGGGYIYITQWFINIRTTTCKRDLEQHWTQLFHVHLCKKRESPFLVEKRQC